MSSKFFTNQNTNTLLRQINHNLEKGIKNNTTHLDFLVGYIRLSGLKNIIDNIQNFQTRILVGLKSDKEIYMASTTEYFSKEQIEDLNDEYIFVDKIQQLIKKKKLEIKITKEKNVHAKLYIFRDDGQKDINGEFYYDGKIIIGSSNLTYNGLEKSYEINTEITDTTHITDGVILFEELYKDAVELTEDDVEKYIKQFIKKPKVISTCKDIFHKSLIEYFGNIVDNRVEINSDTKLFTYQKDAVLSAIFRINKYNGVILGDVVGLGKTVIAVGILQILKERVLIIAPPAIHKQWRDTLKDFHITDYTIKSFEDKYLNENTKNDYKIVLIDESHKLKNEKSARYTKIEKICKEPFRKKVILLSATLQNNSPLDIANQIYLFQDKNNSNIPNIVSLGNFFAPHIATFKTLKNKEDRELVTNSLKAMSQDIKENVLKHLIIRRTRDDIESHTMYHQDIDKFPTIDISNPLTYSLGDMKQDFETTVKYLDGILEFHRFRVLNNLNSKGQDKYKKNNPTMSENIFKKNDLSTLAKYSLIKRFESSFEAFYISIINAITTIEFFINDLQNNRLYVGKDSTKYLNRQSSKREYIYDGVSISYIKNIGKENEQKITLKGTVFSKKDFIDSEKYLEDLEIEKEHLKKLKDIWEINRKKIDPKKEVLIKELNEKSSHKIVIFTEYKDTLNYLKGSLPQNIKDKTLFVTSENRDELGTNIANNFDANIEEEHQDDKYQFIITTDTLAEGVNLHRSDTLFNYDLPWNSTKLMQRMGRINRIGTEFDKLHIYNFKPTDESNNIIGLLEKSFLKLQSFHYTLGEDSKILFDEEVVESFGLHKDGDEELKYLNIIREFKKNSPVLYEKLKKQDGFSVKNINNNSLHVELSFFKINDISYMYKKENEEYNSTDFMTFIEHIERLKEYRDTASHVDDSIKYHIDKINLDKATKSLHVKKTKSEKEAIILLKIWLQEDKIINSTLYTSVEKLLKDRVSSSIAKDILFLSNEEPSKIVEKLEILSENIGSVVVLDTKKVDSKLYVLV